MAAGPGEALPGRLRLGCNPLFLKPLRYVRAKVQGHRSVRSSHRVLQRTLDGRSEDLNNRLYLKVARSYISSGTKSILLLATIASGSPMHHFHLPTDFHSPIVLDDIPLPTFPRFPLYRMLSHISTLFLSISLSLYLKTISDHLPALHGSLPSTLYTVLLPPVSYLFHYLPVPLTFQLLFISSLLPSTALPLVTYALLLLTASTLQPSPPNHLLPFLTVIFTLAIPFIPSLPSIPNLPALTLTLLTTTHILHTPSLLSLLHQSPTSRRAPRQRKKKPFPNSLLLLPRSLRLPNLLLFLYILFQNITIPLGHTLISRLYPRSIPPGYSILAQSRGPTGLISVVERTEKYRMLTADLSVLGGRHICPGCAPDSIFAQFYVHEAVRLIPRPSSSSKKKALCIGLGIGVAADGLARAGCQVDAVELDDVVAKYASKYFGLGGVNLIVDDGLQFLSRVEARTYDFVVHDVFTGGAVPVELFSTTTWEKVKNVTQEDGVVAVNFVGGTEENSTAAGAVALVYDRLEKVFGKVRMFSDGHDSWTHNIVFFASREELKFRPAEEEEFLGSGIREMAWSEFEQFEVKRQDLGGAIADVDGSDWMLHLGQWDTSRYHLKLMRELHTKELWQALYAHEQMAGR